MESGEKDGNLSDEAVGGQTALVETTSGGAHDAARQLQEKSGKYEP